jgi:DNA-binding NarL/FixJ family response regulator
MTATPETPDCPGRYHRTWSAARKGGCICPTAVTAWRTREQERNRRRRPRVTVRWHRQIDPLTVQLALAGQIPARKLTCDERRRAVTTLTQQGQTAEQIADRLNWSSGGRRGACAVHKFRSRWHINANPA